MSALQNMAVNLTINEPPDAYQTFRGNLVRPLKSLEEEEVYYLFRDEDGRCLLIKPRYKGERLEDILLGGRIQVAVAAIIDQEILLSECFRLNQVHYFGIGTITNAENE